MRRWASRQRLADRLARGADLGDGEAVLELDEVDHLARDEVGDAIAHLGLGPDHVMGPDRLEDLGVLGRDGLGPDLLHAKLGQRHHGQNTCFYVGTDADHGPLEGVHAQLAQRVLVGAVGLHDMGQPIGVVLHDLHALVDAEDLVAQLGQRLGERAAEPAQADHHDAVGIFVESLANDRSLLCIAV